MAEEAARKYDELVTKHEEELKKFDEENGLAKKCKKNQIDFSHLQFQSLSPF